MNTSAKKNKKALFIIKIISGLFLVIFIITLIIVPSIIMKDIVDIHVNFKETYEASDFDLTAKELKLTTSDSYVIAAHEVYVDDPKAVVIFISGIHNPSVTSFYGHAKLLKDNGYASILFDMRAHGDSEGDTICLGYKEVLDTKAVVDYITSSVQYTNTPIVVFGVSMGAATAINSIGEIEEIDGLISSSAYSSWEDAFYDNMVSMGVPRVYAWLQRPFVKLYTNFKYGFDTADITPEKEIKKLGDRPALLMHSLSDSQVPYDSFTRIIKHAPKQVETWVREGDMHFIVNEDDFLKLEKDTEYTTKILAFLGRNFGDKQ